MDSALVVLLPHAATVLGFLLAVVLIGHAVRQHERPVTSLAWVMAIVLIPHVGVPAYLLFGGRKLRSLAERKPPLYRPLRRARGARGNDIEDLLCSHGLPPARDGSRVELLTRGEEAYRALVAHIESAEHSIDITTFILGNDAVGRDLIDRLAARAARGVRVRLLVDALGSLKARPRLLPRLERAGGRVGIFMRMLPLHRKWSANLRNHRKIALFDDLVAMTGGMNLAEQYIGADARADRWLDSCLVVEGPPVADLAAVFRSDWEFATGESLPLPHSPAEIETGTPAQVVPSGPDVDGDPLYDAIIAAAYRARERIWIVTPYFLPDDGLLRALRVQGRRGIDVRLIMPLRSNHWSADMVRNRLLRGLIAHGVRAFLHPQRMIHAKHIVIDDVLAVSGSANLDPRSLYLNYEIAVFSYGAADVSATAAWMAEIAAECETGRIPRRTPIRQLSEDLCWLASPLL